MQKKIKQCQSCKKEFTIEPEDFNFYEKMKVPEPTWCPECRLRRRLIWRNGRTLFRRVDSSSGNEIFSGFPEGTNSKVFELEYWKSDSWDALDFGKDYDFSRPFFEQYRELLYSSPWPSKSVQGMVNSEYCDQAGFFKNCYLCFNGDRMEDSAYTTQCTDGKFCFDCSLSNESELCYECVSVNSSYKTVFSQDCENCVEVRFSKNCVNCSNCFGCVNLRDKAYYFFNEKCTKEEYEKKVSAMGCLGFDGVQKVLSQAKTFFMNFPHKYYHGFRAVQSDGDYLRNVKNVKSSYFADDAQDSKFLYNVYLSIKDSYDYGPWGSACSQMYECLTCGDQCNQVKFCIESWPACRNLEYCCFCRSSSDCFGCVSLKKKQYCILNKQYSKEDYFILRDRIIQHMTVMPYVDKAGRHYAYGEFFPEELSPFAYNETVLQEMYPLKKETAIAAGYPWRDPAVREFITTKPAGDIPQEIDRVTDSILKEVIQCAECKRAYRIITQELQFLKKMDLPLPRLCVLCRQARRATLINSPHYYARVCTCAGEKSGNGKYQNQAKHFHGSVKCVSEFETSYAPDRPEIVYCEQCYQQEVL